MGGKGCFVIGWEQLAHSNLHTCINWIILCSLNSLILRSSNGVQQKSNDPFSDLLNKKHKVKKKNEDIKIL